MGQLAACLFIEPWRPHFTSWKEKFEIKIIIKGRGKCRKLIKPGASKGRDRRVTFKAAREGSENKKRVAGLWESGTNTWSQMRGQFSGWKQSRVSKISIVDQTGHIENQTAWRLLREASQTKTCQATGSTKLSSQVPLFARIDSSKNCCAMLFKKLFNFFNTGDCWWELQLWESTAPWPLRGVKYRKTEWMAV